jgi:hypothetical protein
VKTEVDDAALPDALKPLVQQVVPLEGGATAFLRTPRGFGTDGSGNLAVWSKGDWPDDARFRRELTAWIGDVEETKKKLFPDRGKWSLSEEETASKVVPLTKVVGKPFRVRSDVRLHTVQMSEYQEAVYNQVLQEGSEGVAKAVCNFAFPQGVSRKDPHPIPLLVKEKVFQQLRTKYSPKVADLVKTVRTDTKHKTDVQQTVVCAERGDAELVAQALVVAGFVRWPDTEADFVLAPTTFDELKEALTAFNKSDSPLRVFVGSGDVMLPNVGECHFLETPTAAGRVEEVMRQLKAGATAHVYVVRQHRDAETVDEAAYAALTKKKDAMGRWAKMLKKK